MFSHLEVGIPKKPPTPKNIGEGLKGSQRQLWKEFLFVQYDKNQNVILLSAPTPIKSPPEGIKFFRSFIYPIIKEDDCSIFFARQCENGSSRIKCINFDQSYSPVEHADLFRINIAITDMHRFTTRILDVSNVFHNTNFTINKIVCVSTPSY